MLLTKQSRKLLLPILLALLHSPARAQQPLPRFEVTPFAGYRVGGTFRDSASDAEIEFNAGASFGISLNMRAEENTQYELTYSYQATDFDLGSLAAPATNLDADVHYLQLGGTYVWDGALARPYLVATLGLSHIDPRDQAFDSETYFAFSIGPGLKLWPTERFGLRLEGRFYASVVDSDTRIFCVSAGGATCLIRSEADLLWQWEMTVGASWRF